jgi:Rps23 Pro-64 3,4-dihydroxylase Tpa1-like proline 4-hydroxylase
MKFTVVKEPIPFLIIDSTYTKEEQIQIYKELDILVDKLQDSDEARSAKDKNGYFKNNKGVFLEEIYTKIKFSNILTNNRKLFNDDVKNKLIECHYAYKLFNNTNFDTTLLSYYDNGGSYFSHTDRSVISMVTWFYKEPKNFTGGEFKFTDYNLNIEVKNNRTVIFFSSYKHEVSEVTIVNKTATTSGRFSISNFSFIK